MPKILVIEENILLRNMIARLLREAHQVIGAEGGCRGLQLLQSENPALVVTDIGLAQRGIETMRQIRELNPEAKILAIVHGGRLASLDLRRMARSLGACDIVAKPFAPAALVEAVARCLTMP